MATKTLLYFPSKIGRLAIEFIDNELNSLIIDDTPVAKSNDSSLNQETNNKLIHTVLSQLEQYFTAAKAFPFFQLAEKGTCFQKTVWQELMKIPLGETRTYGDIAKNLKSSARAVGNACRKNPIQIIVPCHRVVSAKGIGGYAGETEGAQLDIKRWLLRHEGVLF